VRTSQDRGPSSAWPTNSVTSWPPLKSRRPYVLVGHSVGGVIARDFATRYRELAAALVLVDSSHEQMTQRFAHLDGWRTRQIKTIQRTVRSRLTWLGVLRALDTYGLVRRDRSEAEDEFPAELVDAGMAMDLTSRQRRARIRESLDLERGFAEAYALRQRLDGLPLTVLTATAVGQREPEIQEIWEELQADFAGLAKGSVHEFVDSPHHIHLHRPDLVVQAVLAAHDHAKTSS
jgi:pimeloyl-ACP methyl ester carboxylesterase